MELRVYFGDEIKESNLWHVWWNVTGTDDFVDQRVDRIMLKSVEVKGQGEGVNSELEEITHRGASWFAFVTKYYSGDQI
jgi:hypothetical protein